MTNKHLKSLCITLFVLLGTALCGDIAAKPERIKPNQPYYADEFTRDGEIAELGEERNYEEVFKNYQYYEAIYDEQERPTLFRAYRRGEPEWTERYFYDEQGKLIRKVVERPGKPAEILRFDGSASP